MRDLSEIVTGLEAKISKLIKRQSQLQEQYSRLVQENKGLQLEVAGKQRKIEELENRYDSLRVARTMVGSKEDKHMTKLKINALIREIDKCIVELSD
jgi:regulator of replication initiation timing